MDNVEELYNQKIGLWDRNRGKHAIYMVSRWNELITEIYPAKKKNDTGTDTGTLSRIAMGKQYTLRVNWPGFKGLSTR